MKFLETVKNKSFLIQVGLIIGVTILLIFVASMILSLYTRHGESVPMPKLIGKQLSVAQEELKSSNFELIVRDSIFDNKAPKNSIVSQDPPEGTKIKKHRKIYVTIVAMGSKKVQVPALNDLSLRQATQMLESNGFNVAQIIYQPSEFDNVVIEQRFKGRVIKEGELLEQGSAITLIVGKNGASSEDEETSAEDNNK
jgi:beta-lactam-binding protein with PASTA domain